MIDEFNILNTHTSHTVRVLRVNLIINKLGIILHIGTKSPTNLKTMFLQHTEFHQQLDRLLKFHWRKSELCIICIDQFDSTSSQIYKN